VSATNNSGRFIQGISTPGNCPYFSSGALFSAFDTVKRLESVIHIRIRLKVPSMTNFQKMPEKATDVLQLML
jgi:hypothetical protein